MRPEFRDITVPEAGISGITLYCTQEARPEETVLYGRGWNVGDCTLRQRLESRDYALRQRQEFIGTILFARGWNLEDCTLRQRLKFRGLYSTKKARF